MKWSKYNHMFESSKHGYLIYNSLSNSFIELNHDSYIELKKIKENIQDYDFEKAPGFKEQLREAKIIVDNDLDEFYWIKLSKHLRRYDKSGMSLTIAPTLHCNFACDYCYEASRPPVYMDDGTEKKLIRFVKSVREVKTLFVTWYGGEALLAFDRIRSITEKFKKLKLNYSAALITNGYLLDEAKIRQLENLKIKKIHITIDGLGDVHNKRRPHIRDKDSYGKIIQNLDSLMKYNEAMKVNVIIRVNIDKRNESKYAELYKHLRSRYPGQKIRIYPGFVKNELGACNSTTHELLDRKMQAQFNLKQFRDKGIKGVGFFPSLSIVECMARHINSYLIAPRGEMYKCWTDIGIKEKVVGNLNKKGEFNDRILTRYLTGADSLDEPECRECFHLPICEGRCPYDALENKFNAGKFSICHISKGNLNEFLEAHYSIKKSNNSDQFV